MESRLLGENAAEPCIPTLELVIRETPAHLRRRLRKNPGIALIDLAEEDCSSADVSALSMKRKRPNPMANKTLKE